MTQKAETRISNKSKRQVTLRSTHPKNGFILLKAGGYIDLDAAVAATYNAKIFPGIKISAAPAEDEKPKDQNPDEDAEKKDTPEDDTPLLDTPEDDVSLLGKAMSLLGKGTDNIK